MPGETSTGSPSAPRSLAEQINALGTDYVIELIDDPGSLRIHEIATMNREFGPLRTFDVKDFAAIIEKKDGFLLGHVNDSGALISAAGITLAGDSEGISPLERQLPPWLGYDYCAVVLERYRGSGLQKQLLGARAILARAAGKEGIAVSSRYRNLASLKSLYYAGYIMLADAPQYFSFGEGLENDRVLLLEDFTLENPLQGLRASDIDSRLDKKGLVDLNDVHARIEEVQDVISLPVVQDDAIEPAYHLAVRQLLRRNYIGVSCHAVDSGDSDGRTSDVMVFAHIDVLPVETARTVRNRRDALQSILQGKTSKG